MNIIRRTDLPQHVKSVCPIPADALQSSFQGQFWSPDDKSHAYDLGAYYSPMAHGTLDHVLRKCKVWASVCKGSKADWVLITSSSQVRDMVAKNVRGVVDPDTWDMVPTGLIQLFIQPKSVNGMRMLAKMNRRAFRQCDRDK